MASKNQREYVATLASCSHCMDNMLKLTHTNPDIAFMRDTCETIKNDLNEYISVVTSEDNLTNSNRDDIERRLRKMGGIWNEKEVTAAGIIWFCSGALNYQYDKIENSKRLIARADKTRIFIDQFENMAWTLESLFGNEYAEPESIEMLQTYIIEMG